MPFSVPAYGVPLKAAVRHKKKGNVVRQDKSVEEGREESQTEIF